MRVCDSVCWQYVALYVGFAGNTDDLCATPFDVEAGIFLYHRLTLTNIIDMICKTGPEGAIAWHSSLWNAVMRACGYSTLRKPELKPPKPFRPASRYSEAMSGSWNGGAGDQDQNNWRVF